LIFLEKSVDAKTYLESLKQCFFKEADDVYGERFWVLVQDGESPHTSKDVITELTKRCLLCQFWPTNSPQAGTSVREIMSKRQAIEKIVEIWNGQDMKVINDLYASLTGPCNGRSKKTGD
jgi:hypothetical protein